MRTPRSAKARTIRPSRFFFSREPRGIFFRRDATRSALRDPRFRVSPPRRTSASVTYVSYLVGPSVRAVSGARCRPSPPVQRSRPVTQILPTHAALFWFFFFFLLVRNAALFVIPSPFHLADSGDWQGWGAPDIHDDDGEPRARSPRSSVNLSNDSRRNSIDEPVRRRSIDLRNHGGGEGAIQGLDDPPLR